MKKTKMIFASMALMIGLMATPYQAFATGEETGNMQPVDEDEPEEHWYDWIVDLFE